MQKESGPVGTLGPSKTVHIVGAGVSGLLMGYYLKKAGFQVSIFEAGRVGGKISTTLTPQGIAESAANAIYTNQDVDELLTELGLKPLSSRDKLKKKIWRAGKARSFPLLLREAPRVIFGLFKRPPKNLEGLSVHDFFAPMLGAKTAYETLSAVLGGIYASNAKELLFKSVFKTNVKAKTYFGFLKALAKERKASGHKPRSVSFPGGMAEFIEALRKSLADNIALEKKTGLDESVNTVICADASDAATLLESQSSQVLSKLASELKKVPYRSLSTGTYFFKKTAKELEDSFGILIAPDSGFSCLGILHNSAVFAGRTNSEVLRSYTFISRDGCPEEDKVFADLSKLEGSGFGPEDLASSQVTEWERGIPVYGEQRRQAVMKIRSLMMGKGSGLVLFGNYVDGISIREMVTAAKNFAAASS